MITKDELLLLLNAADNAANLDSLVSLIDHGLVMPVTDIDSIVAIKATDRGTATIAARTLPATTD